MTDNNTDSTSFDKLSDYRNVFKLFDNDNDGMLSADELFEVFKALGSKFTADNVKQFIKELRQSENNSDENVKENVKNNEDIVNFDDFVILVRRHNSNFEDELKAAFDAFDTDNSGTINKQKVSKVFMEKFGENGLDFEIEKMIAQANPDKDGNITFEEFKRVMLRGQQQPKQKLVNESK